MELTDNRFGEVERHPFEPFLPEGARVLLLGSFPPKRVRWSMDFYYPNVNNDMWRIFGLLFFGDKQHFVLPGGRRFDQGAIMGFCAAKGIALYDTAIRVKRLKGNAADKFLEVVEPTDVRALLERIPECRAVVTTGQKATDVVAGIFSCPQPPVGGCVDVVYSTRNGAGRRLRFERMPSSSRAYPLSIEKKAAVYRRMFQSENLL